MRDNAICDRYLLGPKAPSGSGSRRQHDPRRGTHLAHLLPGVGQRGAAARQHVGPKCQVIVELGVVRGEGNTHLRPVGFELLGNQGCQPGGDTLAHLEVLAQDRHSVVGADPEEHVGIEDAGSPRAGRIRFFREANMDAQHESGDTRACTPEERAPRWRPRPTAL